MSISIILYKLKQCESNITVDPSALALVTWREGVHRISCIQSVFVRLDLSFDISRITIITTKLTVLVDSPQLHCSFSTGKFGNHPKEVLYVLKRTPELQSLFL